MLSNISLSFDFGEKQVRTVFMSARFSFAVVRPSTEPVTTAVCKPYFSSMNADTLS